VIPLSGRVPGRVSGPSRSHVDDGGGLHYVFWKRVWALRVFPSRGLYRRKGDVRGWTRRSHPLVAWPGGPAPPVGAAGLWSVSCSPLDSVFVSGN
jgi:hypothetical protein